MLKRNNNKDDNKNLPKAKKNLNFNVARCTYFSDTTNEQVDVQTSLESSPPPAAYQRTQLKKLLHIGIVFLV